MKRITRRQAATTLASFAVSGLALPRAVAQTFPSQGVKVIVPYGAGTATDGVARAIAERLAEIWGVAVTVENVTGAGGVIGSQAVARSRPDGSTLGLVSSSHGINAAVYSKLPYDTMRDFTPLMHVTSNQYVFCVNSAVPANTLQELIALAKAKPNTLTYASSGNGGSVHLATAKLAYMAGIQMTHVPYKSDGAGVTDVLSGQVAFMGTSVGTLLPHIKAGKLRALAVSGERPVSQLPDVPTADQAGVKGYSMTNWAGFVAPAGMSTAVSQRIQADLRQAMKDQRTVERMAARGVDIDILGSEQFEKKVRDEIATWTVVVKASGAKVE